MIANASQPWSEHATAVVIAETGVLIRGRSGAGKSALALALIEQAGSPSCYARLVGDDRVILTVCGGRLLARPHPTIQGMIEQRGEGLIETEYERAVVVRCVVDFARADLIRDIPPRFPDPTARRTAIAGLDFPRLTLPEPLSTSDAARRVNAFVHRLC